MNFSQLSFGVFALKFYGIAVAAAFVVAAWHYYKSLQKKKLSIDFFIHHFWRWLVGGLVVGRIFVLLFDPSIFVRNGLFSFFAFWDGEMHFLGTMFGFIALMWRDLHKSNKAFFQWTDAAMVPLFLGFMIADIGGFLTGAIYGTETALPWGVQYETFGVDILTPVHPVTLYAFLIHLWIWWYLRKREATWERFSGRMTIKAAFFFFGADLLLQFFRGDSTFMVFDFIRAEIILDVCVLAFLWWFTYTKKK